MAYTIADIDKIPEFKTWSDREKIDELLRIDCSMYAHLGTDSTQKERDRVKVDSKRIYRLIKKIDPELGSLFLHSEDTK